MRRYLGAAALALGLAGPAAAVTIDINRNPADAVVPNRVAHPYGGVGLVTSPAGSCTGTPLSRRTILTAAHCIGTDPGPLRFVLPREGKSAIRRAGRPIVHPSYDGRAEPFDQLGAHDAALVRLKRKLPPRVPTYALLGGERPPLGQAFEFVGYGLTGTGATGYQPGSTDFATKRMARNELEAMEPGGLHFMADFDGGRRLGPGAEGGPDSTGLRANNRFGSRGTGVLEGLPAPGDSGGPAFYNPSVAAEVLAARNPGLVFADLPDAPLVMGVASFLTTYDRSQSFSGFGTTASWTWTGPLAEFITAVDPRVRVVQDALLCPDPGGCGGDGRAPALAASAPASIPLPGSLGLLAAGLGGILLARRRRPSA